MSNKSQSEIMHNWGDSQIPLVSICCITYNHERFLAEAIDSFLMQKTSFPFEILIHDDASEDTTVDIIQEYGWRYPDIIRPIFQEENQYSKGGLINLRFVFPQARGKYIALCEGDDYWTDEHKIQKQVTFLEQNPEYVITYTDSRAFDKHGEIEFYFGGATRDVSADELRHAIPLYTLTVCFRNVLPETPLDLISARLGDQVMWSLLGAYGKGKYLPDIQPAAYRVHDHGVLSGQSERKIIEMSLMTGNALYAHYQRMGDKELANFYCEKSFKHSRKLIGWRRLGVMALHSLWIKLARFFGYTS